MNVAVYSGSFRPLHIGHMAVIEYLLEKAGYDMVYLIVSPSNPFKDSGLGVSAGERLAAAREVVSRHPLCGRILVDDIEFGMPRPSYTINTLDALKAREPENAFTLVVGGDCFHEITSWREGGRILSEYGVAVYPREGSDISADCASLLGAHPEYRIRLLEDAQKINVSSTQIREMLAEGGDVTKLLP